MDIASSNINMHQTRSLKALVGENKVMAVYEVRLSIKVLESARADDTPPTGLLRRRRRRATGNRTWESVSIIKMVWKKKNRKENNIKQCMHDVQASAFRRKPKGVFGGPPTLLRPQFQEQRPKCIQLFFSF